MNVPPKSLINILIFFFSRHLMNALPFFAFKSFELRLNQPATKPIKSPSGQAKPSMPAQLPIMAASGKLRKWLHWKQAACTTNEAGAEESPSPRRPSDALMSKNTVICGSLSNNEITKAVRPRNACVALRTERASEAVFSLARIMSNVL